MTRPKRKPAGPPVAPDAFVTLRYRLYDANGRLCDQVSKSEPLRYVHGYAQIIPGLERAIEGARAGDRRKVALAPEEAFGERDDEAVLEIDLRDFPGAERAEVGDEIIATGPDGSECAYRIVAIGDNDIVADRNHPLAGQRVTFEIEVLAVRPASEQELAAAEADVDERIVYADTIVYGSEPEAEPLVQLRRKEKPRSQP